ncbi:MAG: hypothetical protein QNK37_19665 [Acidobacteriota bacterium]|nr:hypothetical protein [Acidobacteriota bacterium]
MVAEYQAGGSGGSPAQVPETNIAATEWRLFSGDWGVVWDGIAVVNMGDAAADVTVTQVTANGKRQTHSLVQSLEPFAKHLALFQSEPFAADPNSYFEIEAAQPLAITALRFNRPDSLFFWENPAVTFGSCLNKDPTSPACRLYLTGKMARFLGDLQDSQTSGLVPLFENSTATTTYTNALAAIAFTVAGNQARAKRIFDVFAQIDFDPCPACSYRGGFQQHRSAVTGAPVEADPNDFWIGDNAWLLAALKFYRKTYEDDTSYDTFIDSLKSWFVNLESEFDGSGIHSGFQRNGDYIRDQDEEILFHHEGNIDVYCALNGLDAEPNRTSVKNWLDAQVWQPNPHCFELVPSQLATDHVSFGVLSLGPDYQCITAHAETRTARHWQPYLVENWSRPIVNEPGCDTTECDWYWHTEPDPERQVDLSVSREEGPRSDQVLKVSYHLAEDAWFRLFRNRNVDFNVSGNFNYYFWLEGNRSGNTLEVKLKNSRNETYRYNLTLDFDGWRIVGIENNQLCDFFNSQVCNPDALGNIIEIEFAVNAGGSPNIDGEANVIRIGDVWYEDRDSSLPSLDAFAAFEFEKNRIFVEGTAQMAAAYGALGKLDRWKRYVNSLYDLLQSPGELHGLGLPYELFIGKNRADPSAVATSWYILALSRFNPCEP